MFIIIYITHPNEETATSIVQHLLKKKTVACGNIFPITSAYWWQGNIENESEFVSIVKTAPENWETVVKLIKQLHPYETPCIMQLEATANIEYEEWIRNEISIVKD